MPSLYFDPNVHMPGGLQSNAFYHFENWGTTKVGTAPCTMLDYNLGSDSIFFLFEDVFDSLTFLSKAFFCYNGAILDRNKTRLKMPSRVKSRGAVNESSN